MTSAAQPADADTRPSVTPRDTRLVRVPDLRAFRDALASLACEGDTLAARDRILVVPTRAAAAHLTRAIEDRVLATRSVAVLPDVVTRDELYERLASRLPGRPRLLDPFEREALLAAACRAAAERSSQPPFRLRPGIVAEILRFYDDLHRHENDLSTFEARAVRMLEPSADVDRGAERLLRQTRFFVAAFTDFQQRCEATGALDERTLRRTLLDVPSPHPVQHAIVTVRDRAGDPYGLWNCDFDLLARLPGLKRVDIVITEQCLAGALHERLHRLFPGIAEERWAAGEGGVEPLLLVPPKGGVVHVSRDREEEVADFARRVKQSSHSGTPALPHSRTPAPAHSRTSLDRIALVVRRPLPYVYLAREVFRAAALPIQMFDALPLAAEPYAAALDLVLSCVSSNFARTPLIALLQSPYLRVEHGGRTIDARDLAILDRALSDAGYLGEAAALAAIVTMWKSQEAAVSPRAVGAGSAAIDVVRELTPLRSTATVSSHLDTLLAFLTVHGMLPEPADPLRERQLRARAALLGALQAIRAAHAVYDSSSASFDDVAATVRRWIESHTFAPRTGDAGVHLVDAESARYGDFDDVQLGGLVEGEWPDRPRRNIFYSPVLLQELGWASEKERLEAARGAFIDLMRLPSRRLVLSSFTLEDDAVVIASPFLDEVEGTELGGVEYRPPPTRIFEWEALGIHPPRIDILPAEARVWGELRLAELAARHRGATAGHHAPAFSVSALERYQDCPFKFFAADVLRLEEAPEDEPSLSPRARGRFIHEVFQQFFEKWDAQGVGDPAKGRTITADRVDEARALFKDVAEPLLARLPEAEASLERTRLFGSAIAVGIVDVVLGIEAARPMDVVSRWLEYRLDGEFTLGSPDGRRVSLRGVADRIDVLAGDRLRVIDYKSGSAPNVKRALQVPVYALCATERFTTRDGRAWSVDEAAYVAFSGKRALVPVVKAGSADPSAILGAARARVVDAVDAIARGEFPPRPFDPMICTYCAYATVCRKDYVGDE